MTESFPKQCADKDVCGVTKEFATRHLLQNHRALHHDPNWPANFSCNVPGCQMPESHHFVSWEAFRRRLASYHFLDEIAAQEYIGKVIANKFKAPRGTCKNYLQTMCLIPECKTQAEFGQYADYCSHLKKTYGLTAEQYPLYMLTATTVRLQCPDREICGVDKPFANKHLLSNHNTLHLDSTWPDETPCNVPGCQLPKFQRFDFSQSLPKVSATLRYQKGSLPQRREVPELSRKGLSKVGISYGIH